MFKELSKKSAHERELEILKEWQEKDILNLTIENRKDNENFVFYDGPATANGMPGLHHMVGKFIKDSICKYHTMKGSKVLRKIGWDTHGLPVEVQVEKKLGFQNKNDIEKYGIKEFNDECRKTVWENEEAFERLTNEMGQFIDLKNRYITYDNNYIETEWYILKKFFDEGLFYEGHKILPYCTRCGTGLASHEVAQGYKEVTVETVIVPFKKKNEENTYFLVWTTTPWTLLSNVALCVNPDETYVKVNSKGYNFILAEKLANTVLGSEYEVIETYKGKELEYAEYEQLIPELKVDKKAFFVTCDTYVTMEDGTGIVHIAPAFGIDDDKVGKKYDLPYLNPVGEDGCYTEGPWKKMKVFDADIEVIKYLKENDKLFKKQKMVHNYPHCWRCNTPLLYYSKPSFYLEITKLKDKIIEENKKVKWYPEFVGEKRFGNWLENLPDWPISRSRYWGTPLPLWRCECGNMCMIGSRKELIEKSIENIDETIELHRPYVDNIHIKCPKCGKTMNRVPDVIDCWFDSGSMPFAQYHYPFENMELWSTQYPADFIAEGIDQTRGWFYSLIVIGVFLTGKSPYKSVLVNELLLDKYGKKMHKSKGNAVEPFTLINKYGSDAIRWYLPYVGPVWTPIKFDEEGVKEVVSKFFNTLKNTYNFFAMYANADHLETQDFINATSYEMIDKWLLSKYNKLVKEVTQDYDEYDLNKVVKAITEFVSEELSNWYIRRNRRRFWKGELDDSKLAVYKVTYEVLLGLTKLIAPICPFISEDIYKNLTNQESVHLSDFPQYDPSLINVEVETKMDLVRNLISLGRGAREEANIKIRQPLSKVLIDSKNEEIIKDLEDLIKEELNVKEVSYITDSSNYLTYEIKPNYKEVGKIFGKNISELEKLLKTYTSEDIKDIDGKIITINGEEYTLNSNMLDIRVHSKEGYNTLSDTINYVILDVTITKELENEGIVRDLIRNLQLLRKEIGLDISDRIKLEITSDAYQDIIKEYKEEIENELLATLTNNLTSKEYNYKDDFNNTYIVKIEKEK